MCFHTTFQCRYLVQRPVGRPEPKLALLEGVRPRLGGPADVGKVGAPEAGDVAVLEPRRLRPEQADRQHLTHQFLVKLAYFLVKQTKLEFPSTLPSCS